MRRTAEMYCVPKSTLQDRISSRVVFGTKSGPESYLTKEEEEQLVDFIQRCSDIDYSRMKMQIIKIVQQVVNENGKDAKVSFGWWASFRKRHSDLTLRTAEPVSYVQPNLTVAKFCQWVNEHFLPSQTLEPGFLRKISHETWMHQMRFSVVTAKKGAFVDGHECQDVVAIIKSFCEEW